MRRFSHRSAIFMATGILLGTCTFLSAGDERRVPGAAALASAETETERLIDQLRSKRFMEREQATNELSKLGKSALPSLKEAAKSPDAEVRRRAQQLVERIDRPPAPLIDSHSEPQIRAGKCYL